MSVALSTPPPAFAFSADYIVAQFQSTDYLNVVGVKSLSSIYLPSVMADGTFFRFKYGANDFNITVKNVPDDSGLQIPNIYAGLSNIEAATALANALKTNPKLNADFDIDRNGEDVRLTAKTAGVGFDFSIVPEEGPRTIISGVEEEAKPNYSIQFKLYLENENYTGFDEIYSTQLQLIYGRNGLSQVYLNDKLHSAIEKTLRQNFLDQPDNTALLCKKSSRQYYFEFAESYGETITVKKIHASLIYTVLHGGFSTKAKFNKTLSSLIAPSTVINDRFLKQGSNTIYTRTNQPQYLYFFNTRATVSANLVCELESITGTTTKHTLYSLSLQEKRKYGFNVTFDQIKDLLGLTDTIAKYKIYLENEAAERISEIRTYYLDYSQRNYTRYFLFWSSFGSLDTRVCYGEGESEFELFNTTAQRISRLGDDIKAGQSFTFGSKLKRNFKISTGWMSRKDLQLNADFFLANYKYRFTGGLMLPIEVPAGKIPEITDGNNLYAQQFEYKYHFEDHCYTEGDAEDSGDIISDFFFSTPSIIFNPSGFTETDPTVPSWVKSITLADITKWNSGTQSGLFQPLENQRLSTDSNVSFAGLSATSYFIPPVGAPDPEDIPVGKWAMYIDENGYGASPSHVIARLGDLLDVDPTGDTDWVLYKKLDGTFGFKAASFAPSGDVYTKTEINNFFGGVVSISGYNKSNWDNAFGWGNHASAGYALASGTNLSGYNPTNWNAAYTNSHTHANKAFLDTLNAGVLNGKANLSGGNTFSGNQILNENLTVNGDIRLSGSKFFKVNSYSFSFPSQSGTLALFSQVEDVYNLAASRAKTDGSNASGTWNINISGSAFAWDGLAASFGTIESATIETIIGRDNNGAAYRYNKSAVKNFIAGQTLNNNISGSADKWSNQEYDNTSGSQGIPNYLMGYNSSVSKWTYQSPLAVKAALATSLQNVTDVSATTTNGLVITASRPLETVGNDVLFAKNGGAHNIIFGDGNVRYYSLYTPMGASYGSIRNFSTSTNILSFTEYGRIGIGTDAPITIFDVRGNVYFKTTSNAAIRFLNNGANEAIIDFEDAAGGWQTGSLRAYNFNFFTNGTNNRLAIANNGNVGIGTTSPTQKLDVAGDIAINSKPFASIYGSGMYTGIYAGTTDFRILRNDGGAAHLVVENASGNVLVPNGSILANTFAGYSGGDVILTTNTSGTAKLIFKTALTTRAVIDENGNLGIGTTSPAAKFHVVGTSYLNGDVYLDKILPYSTPNINIDANVGLGISNPSEKLEVNGNINSTGNAIGFSTTDIFEYDNINRPHYGLGWGVGGSGKAYTTLSGYYGLSFFTNGANRLTIANNGNVGIGGITSPAYTLDVNGSIRAQNDWFRSTGPHGWYHEIYGGGIYMTDSTYVRVYGGKQFYADNYIATATGFLAHNYGAGLVGQYSSVRYQEVFSMGAPYRPALDGTSLNNHYGIAWTHSNIGGQSKAGLGHQMLITEAGVTQTAIGNGIWTRANIYAAGKIEAPTVKATNLLIIPVGAPNPADIPTGKWAMYIDEN